MLHVRQFFHGRQIAVGRSVGRVHQVEQIAVIVGRAVDGSRPPNPAITRQLFYSARREVKLQGVKIEATGLPIAGVGELIPAIGLDQGSFAVVAEPFLDRLPIGLLDIVIDGSTADAVDEHDDVAPVHVRQAVLFQEPEHELLALIGIVAHRPVEHHVRGTEKRIICRKDDVVTTERPHRRGVTGRRIGAAAVMRPGVIDHAMVAVDEGAIEILVA